MKEIFYLSGENQKYDEITQEIEGNIANTSYILNMTDSADYSAKFKVLFEVCEGGKMVLHCSFLWKRQSNKTNVVSWISGNETKCFANHRSLSNSFLTFEIQISLLVKRSYSLMKFSIADTDETFKTLRAIRLDVPCKCTNINKNSNTIITILLKAFLSAFSF